MKSDPKQFRTRLRAMLAARVFVAAIVALSFLITVAPLGTASSDAAGMMDCCVGKPGHESGSCATGLLESANTAQPASPGSHDRDPASPSDLSLTVVAGAGAEEHCHAPAAGTPASTTVLADPEANLTTAKLELDPVTVEATDVPTAESGLPSVHMVSQPCYEECGACPSGAVRRPKPRDTALPVAGGQMRVCTRGFGRFQPRPVEILRLLVEQTHPRGPPSQTS